VYRHELKLSINALDRAVLSTRLSKVLPRDPHSGPGGTYTVRSIYFDDDRDTALLQKLTGQLYREKFRLRTYGRDSGVIYLERKIKRGNLGCKEKARL